MPKELGVDDLALLAELELDTEELELDEISLEPFDSNMLKRTADATVEDEEDEPDLDTALAMAVDDHIARYCGPRRRR